jgi:hypothetical protein
MENLTQSHRILEVTLLRYIKLLLCPVRLGKCRLNAKGVGSSTTWMLVATPLPVRGHCTRQQRSTINVRTRNRSNMVPC